MKGVVLAGGHGTRLRPLTYTTNKHLLPIYDRQMVLFPIDTLKQMGIKDIMLVTGGEHIGHFAELLGDGSDYGVEITYRVQRDAGGIAQALGLARDFVGGEKNFAVILGDNIFSEPVAVPEENGLVVAEVEDPERFGVYHNGAVVEKPERPTSNMAVTGLYFYTPEVFSYIECLEPSDRGELEITDVNNWVLKHAQTDIIEYPGFWSDAGTLGSMKKSAEWRARQVNGTL